MSASEWILIKPASPNLKYSPERRRGVKIKKQIVYTYVLLYSVKSTHRKSCGSGSGPLFSLRCISGSGSDLSLWCGSGSVSDFWLFDADPHTDPVPRQSDTNLRPVVYGPFTAPFQSSTFPLWASTAIHCSISSIYSSWFWSWCGSGWIRIRIQLPKMKRIRIYNTAYLGKVNLSLTGLREQSGG